MSHAAPRQAEMPETTATNAIRRLAAGSSSAASRAAAFGWGGISEGTSAAARPAKDAENSKK
jgi:hypothetical protein